MKKKKLDVVIVTFLSLLFTLCITWNYKEEIFLEVYFARFIFVFIVVELLFTLFWNKLVSFKLKKINEPILKKEYILYALIIIIPLIIGSIVYFPFCKETDTLILWNEMQKGVLNNWHPIFYSLIFFGIPSLLSNHIFSATVFQLLFVFFSLMYLCNFCRKNYVNFKEMTLILILITFNPIFIKFSMTVVKDIPYSYTMLILTLHLLNIIKSDGKWLKKPLNKIAFILSNIGVLALRHNGIVPFVLSFILLIIFFPKLRKSFSIMFVAILLPFLLITGPIFKTLGINRVENKTEFIGIVLGNLSYYYRYSDYGSFTKDELELLFELAPKEVWDYRGNEYRNFNYIKFWNYGPYPGDSEIVEDKTWYRLMEEYPTYLSTKVEQNFTEVMKLWFNKSKKYPVLFLKSYLNMTSPIWEIKSDFEAMRVLYTVEGTDSNNNAVEDYFTNYYQMGSSTPLRWLFVGFGEGLFIIIVSLMLVIKKTSLELKKLIPFIPVLSNTAIIMLLITGEEYRFVYSQVTCFLPLLLYSLSSMLFVKKKKNRLTA